MSACARGPKWITRVLPWWAVLCCAGRYTHFAGAVHFAKSQLTHLAGAHPGQALQFDHAPEVRGEEGQGGSDVRGINRFDRLRLASLGPPLAQPASVRIA